ncbi:condensation domain-containing protein [Pseudomonas sp. R3-41]
MALGEVGADAYRVSLNAVLLTVYLQTLARWSGKATVTCSVMYSSRPGLAKEFARHIGNFADTVLIDLPNGPRAFSAIVQHLQQDLCAAMQHGAYDGVSAVRELIKLHDQRASSAEPPMPNVFSSLLEMDLPAVPLEQTDHAMMTPQIWIDAQTFSHKGELWLSWDEREGVFPPGVIAQAFEHFHAILQRLATEPGEWDDTQVSPALLATVNAFNHTQQAFDSGALYQGLLHQAVQRPDAPAILDAQGGLSFGQLLCQASRLASHLNENGVGPSDHVVIRGQP